MINTIKPIIAIAFKKRDTIEESNLIVNLPFVLFLLHMICHAIFRKPTWAPGRTAQCMLFLSPPTGCGTGQRYQGRRSPPLGRVCRPGETVSLHVAGPHLIRHAVAGFGEDEQVGRRPSLYSPSAQRRTVIFFSAAPGAAASTATRTVPVRTGWNRQMRLCPTACPTWTGSIRAP